MLELRRGQMRDQTEALTREAEVVAHLLMEHQSLQEGRAVQALLFSKSQRLTLHHSLRA